MADEAIVQRGEVLRLSLEVESGDPATIASIAFRMRRLAFGEPTGDAIALASTFVAAAGGTAAHWLVTLADTSTLAAGHYAVDARYVIAGEAYITDPCPVRIAEGPSSP